MKKSEVLLTFTMPKFSYKVKDGEKVQEVQTMSQYMPLNVIDKDYFKDAVQYNVFRFGDLKLMGDYRAELAKKDFNLEKVEKLESEYRAYNKLFNDWKKSLADVYEEVNDALAVFRGDGFSRLYALYLTGIDSYKTVNDKNEVSTVHMHFHDTATEDAEIYKHLATWKDVDGITEQEKKNKKKTATDSINSFANGCMRTNGGIYYKKITYDITQTLINNYLIPRSEKLMQAGKNGGIKKDTHSPFKMSMQLFIICLYTQGVPFEVGKGKVEYYEKATTGNDSEQMKELKRKDRKPRTKKAEQKAE